MFVRLLIGFAALVLLWPGTIHAQDEGPEAAGPKPPIKVKRVRFEGNRRYTDAFLKEQIATKEGEEYDPGLHARDERALREFFSAVTDIERNDIEGGVEIVFHVIDKTVVGQVFYRGLARVKQRDFEDLMLVRPGRPLLLNALQADEELLRRLHKEKGYHFVSVKGYRKETSKPDVEDIIFQVIPAERVRVKKVTLEGVRSVKKYKILKVLKNNHLYRSQYLTLGRLLNPSFYDRSALEQDRRKIEVWYEREGWLDARAVFVDTTFDKAREYAFIRFRVSEGSRYKVSSVKVLYAPDGEPNEEDLDYLSTKRLEALATIGAGDPYRVEDIRRTQRAIQSRLWEKAYAKVQVRQDFRRNADKKTVEVRFILTANEKVRAGRIRIYGNKWTRDNVIRRQFRDGAQPGDYLDIDALQAGITRLQKLRYFSLVRFRNQQWGLVRDPNAESDDIWDIELEVEETDTRQFSVGAGVSTDGGAFGQFSVTWRNFDIRKPPDRIWDIFDESAFRGGGQRFTVSAAPGTTFSTFSVSFADPALRDSRWSFTTNFFRRIALFDDYDQTTDGANIGVGRYLDPKFIWRLDLRWSLRQVTIDDPDPDAPVNALDVQGSNAIHSVGFTIRRSRRREADPFLNGYVTSLAVDFSGGPLGAEVDIIKVSVRQRAGWRIAQRRNGGWHRVRVAFGASYAAAFDDTPEVPIFERYFLGGRNLRGFEFREVGPRSNGSPTGGEFMVTLSVQYTLPIVGREATGGFGFDLVFFVDQGGIATEFDDWNSDAWRVSAGFGLAIGFGGPNQPPLQIDFGFPLVDQNSDKAQLVSIAFERNF